MTWRWILVMTVTWAVASPDPRFNMDLHVTASPATLGDKDQYRLPAGPRPSHYQLYLAYDIDPAQEFPFYGLVKIQLSSNISTSEITLHAQDFNVVNDEVSITDKSGKKMIIDGVNKNADFNFLIIRLKEAITPGTAYELVIPFWGNLKPALEGAYISSYDDAMTGKKEHLVTTQFEAISARKAFPCFDEPDMKASFAIHLAHHKDYVAISNMPVSNHTKENLMSPYWSWDTMAKRFGSPSSVITDSWVWDTFSESVPMSTYLVAWVVSKFGHITSPPGLSHVNFKIWARKDALSQAEYASVIGPKVLTFYENWFNVSFPLPKQDMIAIPDFSAGAMENWGLVTYRETALLYDPGRSSQINKERVAEVVAHELAHQWFGNLVTMEWWTDLWLNEGFATYMAILGVDAVEPSWDTTVSAVVDNTRNVLSLDALKSSHPISVTVHDPKMIDEIFDAISYSKGSALIYMMNKFLGEDIFKKGINRYLVAHSYENADQSKLWSALSSAAEGSVKLPKGKSVRDIMDTWTLQSGYPLLQVNRDYDSKTLKVEQHRFLSLNQTNANENKEAWWVPLAILSEAEIGQPSKPLSWLAPTEGIQEGKQFDHNAAASQWIVFNVDMIAPLRVTYDDKNWGLLIDTLVDSKKYKQIPVYSRVQLLDDAFALAKVSRLPYETTLRLATYLKHETEYEPLDTGLSVLGYIQRLLSRDPDYGVIRTFLRDLITPQFEAVGGLSVRPRSNKELKMQVLTASIACRVGAGDCEEAALRMLEQWMANPNATNPIPQDLRSVVYCTAIRRGGANHWEFLNQQRIKSNLATEQVSLLRALACSRQVWILRRYLEWALTGQESIRSQDAASVISGITSNPEGFSIARDFVFERIEELHERFSGQKRRIGGVISSVLRHFTTQRELDQFLNWQKEHAKYLDESKLAVQQAIESSKINIDWTTRFKTAVVQIMKKLKS